MARQSADRRPGRAAGPGLRSGLLGAQARLDGAGARLARLRESEQFTAGQLRGAQADRLASLLRHCYREVPYYQRLFAEVGVTRGGEGRLLDSFASLPLLDKATIRSSYDELKSRDLAARRWFLNRSSGSTGEPVSFIQDEAHRVAAKALKLLFDEWAGYRPGQRKAILWGSTRDLTGRSEPWRTRLGRWARNERWLNSFQMSPAQMRAYAGALRRFRPRLFLTYAQTGHEFARFLERERLDAGRPGAVMTSASTLHPAARGALEPVFGAPVHNRYGSIEVADPASECSTHEGLHVSPTTHLLEVLRADGSPAGPGEAGEVVVTPLTNFAMPLLRYRVGDVAEWTGKPCSCGRAWPLLATVHGRTFDDFVRADGELVRGGLFTQLLFEFEWVARFQVIQEELDLVRVVIQPVTPQVDPGGRFGGDLAAIAAGIRRALGGPCQVRFEFPALIPDPPGGKTRYVISRVARP